MSKKLYPCKSCGQQIAKKAKRCPHCGAKNKKKHPLVGLILIVIIVLVIAKIAGGKDDSKEMSVATNPVMLETQPISQQETKATEATWTDTVTETEEETEAATEVEPEPETEPATEETESETVITEPETEDGIRPEFKEAMDSYEDFFEEYCEFMEKYQKNPNDITLIAKYAVVMTQYAKTMEEMEEWEDTDLNDEEMKYYLEVTSRINKMLIDVATE